MTHSFKKQSKLTVKRHSRLWPYFVTHAYFTYYCPCFIVFYLHSAICTAFLFLLTYFVCLLFHLPSDYNWKLAKMTKWDIHHWYTQVGGQLCHPGLGPLRSISWCKWWCGLGLLQCLPPLPWCSSYPVHFRGLSGSICDLSDMICSSREWRAVLAKQAQGETEGDRKNSVFLGTLCVFNFPVAYREQPSWSMNQKHV